MTDTDTRSPLTIRLANRVEKGCGHSMTVTVTLEYVLGGKVVYKITGSHRLVIKALNKLGLSYAEKQEFFREGTLTGNWV